MKFAPPKLTKDITKVESRQVQQVVVTEPAIMGTLQWSYLAWHKRKPLNGLMPSGHHHYVNAGRLLPSPTAFLGEPNTGLQCTLWIREQCGSLRPLFAQVLRPE